MYSIKAIASLTGLGTETLRAWERRYKTIVPDRDDSGHRYYSQQDLDRLTLLANLTRQGHSISKISGLSIEELQKLHKNEDENGLIQRQFTEQIVEALLNYRIERCEQLLKRALMANEPLTYLRDILTPALCEVGQLWHDEKLSVAQEHMFSACVKRILLGMVNNLHSFSANRPAMLFATPSGEPHEFGILMCCLLAAELDYNCYYLGPNLPAGDIIEAAEKLKCEVIVMSLVKYPPDIETTADLNHIVQHVNPEKTAIWLGGQGARCWEADREEDLPANMEIILDIDFFYTKAHSKDAFWLK